MKYTPGPWVACFGTEEDGLQIRTKDEPSTVLAHIPYKNGEEDKTGDAFIIAAAPMLLASLKEIRAYLIQEQLEKSSTLYTMLDSIADTIAKAEGLK